MPRTRWTRLSNEDLEMAAEQTLGRLAELSRGLRRTDVDRGWVLSEMETNAVQFLETVQTIKERNST